MSFFIVIFVIAMIPLQNLFSLLKRKFKQRATKKNVILLFITLWEFYPFNFSLTWGKEISLSHTKQHFHHHTVQQDTSYWKNVEEENILLATVHQKRKILDEERSQQETTIKQSRLHSKETQAIATLSRQKAETLSRASREAEIHLIETKRHIATINAQIQTIHTSRKTLQATLSKELSTLLTLLPQINYLSHHSLTTAFASQVEQNDTIKKDLILRGFSHYIKQRIQNTLQEQEQEQEQDNDLSTKKIQLAQIEQTQQNDFVNISQQAHQAHEEQKQAEADTRLAREQLQHAIQQADSLQDAIARLETLETTVKAALQQKTLVARYTDTTISATETPKKSLITAPSLSLLHSHNNTLKLHSTAKIASRQRESSFPLITHTPFDINHAIHPVKGTLITRWGSPTEAGPATSMIYNTPFSALVRAPCSGSVDFAGIFRSYGQMVILNCGQHYRFILAGLSNLSVNTGQKLLKGTQIGHMGTTNTTTRLLLQLRHGQQIINPSDFL